MRRDLAPGTWVRLPAEPDWGLGQVQTVAGNRVTINFEHAGKRLIQADRVEIDVEPDQFDRR